MRRPDDDGPRAAQRTLRWSPIGEWSDNREPDWLVAGMLTRGSVSALIGPPFAGKSWLAAHLATTVAIGSLFFGASVRSGPVVYGAGERCAVTRRRITTMTEGRQDRPPIAMLSAAMNLALARDARAFGQAIDEITTFHGAPPALIVVDTLARFSLGVDENAAGPIGLVMQALAELAERTGAHVMILHHLDKEGRRARGSTAITGAVDTVLRLGSDREGRWFEVAESNDGEPGARHRFSITDGRLTEADRRVAPSSGALKTRLSPDVSAVLRALTSVSEPIDLARFDEVANDALMRVKPRDVGSLRQARFKARRALSEAGHIIIDGGTVSVSKTSASVSGTVSADAGETSARSVSKHPPIRGDANAADARRQITQ